MSRAQRHRLSLAAIALVAALPLSLALGLHPTDDHLATPALGDETVYFAGHDQADRSLHIEPIAGTWDSHCPGCILREQSRSNLVAPPAGSVAVLARAAYRTLEPVLSLDPALSRRVPRAPPAG